MMVTAASKYFDHTSLYRQAAILEQEAGLGNRPRHSGRVCDASGRDAATGGRSDAPHTHEVAPWSAPTEMFRRTSTLPLRSPLAGDLLPNMSANQALREFPEGRYCNARRSPSPDAVHRPAIAASGLMHSPLNDLCQRSIFPSTED